MKTFTTFLLTLTIALTFTCTAAAEGRDANNSVFVEGGGAGFLYSINYERLFGDLGLRVGFSYLPLEGSMGDTSATVDMYNIPLAANFIGIGGRNHALELSGGVTVVHVSGTVEQSGFKSSGSGTGGVITASAGYRYHASDGGFQFRLGVTSLIGKGFSTDDNASADEWGALPWAYTSLGGTF